MGLCSRGNWSYKIKEFPKLNQYLFQHNIPAINPISAVLPKNGSFHKVPQLWNFEEHPYNTTMKMQFHNIPQQIVEL